jgi:zinc/manganese transport system substrate-binding protein
MSALRPFAQRFALHGLPRRLGPWLGLALVGALVACRSVEQQPQRSARSARLKVVSTVLPITLFTRAVAGDCAEVTPLLPPGTGPHHFQAKPADLAALRAAAVLVKNGLELEDFLAKLVESAQNPRLVVIDSSRDVATLNLPLPGNHSGKQMPDGHQAEDHTRANPHIWLDPLRAVQQVEAIRDGLVQADPDCAKTYGRNAQAFIAQLRELNREIASELKPYQGKSFVAFHDFAPYFAQRYGLKPTFLVDLPELNPTPVDLIRVASEVKRSGLKAVLSEPQEGDRSFNALARDLGVQISLFDPLETGTEQQALSPATYFKVMRSNVAQLRQAFGG